jgi:hypothetical protein
MTVPKPFVNPPSCENPLGIRKSTAHDAHDAHDDELQRFSKGVGQLICVTTPPIIVGLTNLSIYRPGRGEPVDGSLVDGRGAASVLQVNTEAATPARIE